MSWGGGGCFKGGYSRGYEQCGFFWGRTVCSFEIGGKKESCSRRKGQKESWRILASSETEKEKSGGAITEENWAATSGWVKKPIRPSSGKKNKIVSDVD